MKAWEESGGSCANWQEGPVGRLWLELEVSLKIVSKPG